MHTNIAAAADWQFEASLFEANCKNEKNCPFMGPHFVGATIRPNVLNMPKSASAYRWVLVVLLIANTTF